MSLVRIPRKWYYVFAWTFSVLVIGHTIADLGFGWGWKALGNTPAARMAALMTFIVGWFFITSHLSEEIMLGYAKQFKAKVFAAGKTEGIAEGMTRGIAEGMTRGKKELLEEFQEALKKGMSLEDALGNYEAENGDIVNNSADDNEK